MIESLFQNSFLFGFSFLSSAVKQQVLFINIHSHLPPTGNEWVLQSLYQKFGQTASPGRYSIGLHPWYISASERNKQTAELKKWSTQENVLAIGECGLDKVCSTDFILQQEVFAEQLQWANKIHKPLILHCVKAYDEVLHLLKEYNNTVPVIFHGFNKSKELAKKIISKGYYLSFGKALLQQHVRETISELPVEFIFLETDDSDIAIEKVYELAATSLQITKDSLSLQIRKNAAAVFGVSTI